jgi:hypothetical protein
VTAESQLIPTVGLAEAVQSAAGAIRRRECLRCAQDLFGAAHKKSQLPCWPPNGHARRNWRHARLFVWLRCVGKPSLQLGFRRQGESSLSTRTRDPPCVLKSILSHWATADRIAVFCLHPTSHRRCRRAATRSSAGDAAVIAAFALTPFLAAGLRSRQRTAAAGAFVGRNSGDLARPFHIAGHQCGGSNQSDNDRRQQYGVPRRSQVHTQISKSKPNVRLGPVPITAAGPPIFTYTTPATTPMFVRMPVFSMSGYSPVVPHSTLFQAEFKIPLTAPACGTIFEGLTICGPDACVGAAHE